MKNGMVKVEIIKPTVGTIALKNGLGIAMAFRYKLTAKYVNSAKRALRDQLVSQALSISTLVFLSSIRCNLCSRFSILLFCHQLLTLFGIQFTTFLPFLAAPSQHQRILVLDSATFCGDAKH
ncbi:MAG: hypothetical protein Q7S34_02170 [bacterium]|nr:hypothetical protein [bacterium]